MHFITNILLFIDYIVLVQEHILFIVRWEGYESFEPRIYNESQEN